MSDRLFNGILVAIAGLVMAFITAGALGAFDATPSLSPTPVRWLVK